jgi:protein O-mannosyl-transferase
MNRTLSTLLVVLCGFAAYANSFQGAFVFDDLIEIARNPAVHRLWPPWVPMFGGNDVAARPLPYLSFAIDHALYDNRPFGFHATNLAIHLLCAVLLMWLVTETLRGPAFSTWWHERSLAIATAVAAIWVVHPLTTQAVTYIYQRMESMAALLIVAAVASAAAAFSTGLRAETATRRRSWQAAACCCGLLAALSKETAAGLPLLVAAFWWIYRSRSDGETLRRRLPFFITLTASTWLPLAAVLAAGRGDYVELRKPAHPPLEYLITQAEVIVHYVRLAFWPAGQNLDYDWQVATSMGSVWWQLGTLVAAAAVTLRGCVARMPWSFPTVAFFVLLGPTSSFLPVADIAVEHRMYLPLACPVALVVGGMAAACERFGSRVAARAAVVAATVCVVALGATTHARNRAYESFSTMWHDCHAKNPRGMRANWHLAVEAAGQGDVDRAIELAGRSTEAGTASQAFHGCAKRFFEAGNPRASERVCREGMNVFADHDCLHKAVWFDLAVLLTETLVSQGRVDEASTFCGDTLPLIDRELGAGHPMHFAMQTAELRGRLAGPVSPQAVIEAERLDKEAVAALGADHPVALTATTAHAAALAAVGQDGPAEQLLRTVVALEMAKPLNGDRQAAAIATLANFLASRGRNAEANAVRAATNL